jgi:hypothetical protein
MGASNGGSGTRLLSQSEIGSALDCQARWDFGYGGRLAGSALKAKRVAPILSEGRAWGAAAARWHTNGFGLYDACDALADSLSRDAERQREFRVYDPAGHEALRKRLTQMLTHYHSIAEQIPMDPVTERELNVPIPSRTGHRVSSRYRLLGYIDATREVDGRTWLVEFKLRGRLSTVQQISLSRQIRWYAWAYERETGIPIAGVETVERWNEVPKLPRLVKTGRKDGALRPSHATDQLCTADDYLASCAKYDEEPHDDVLAALRERRWQQRVPIVLRRGEMDEVGRELVSAGRLIAQLDSGLLYPMRNAKPQNCNGCSFRDICAAPDPELVDALYERIPAKRDREETPA